MKLEARGYVSNLKTQMSKAGKVYTTFQLGVKQRDKAYKDKPETVTWANFNVTDFSGTEVSDRDFVTVDGFFKVRKYTDKNGNERQALDLVAQKLEVAPAQNGNPGKADAPQSKNPGSEPDPWE